MLTCNHLQWLEITGRGPHWSVEYASRLQVLAHDLPSPDTQFPSIVYFLGRKTKSLALRSVLSNNNTRRRGAHGVANLYLDLTTQAATYPIYLADCNPTVDSVNGLGVWNGCHEPTSFRINLGESGHLNPRTVADHLRTRLLFPLSDVICLFADDLPDLPAIVSAWTRFPSSLILPIRVRPRLVIVYQRLTPSTAKLDRFRTTPDFQQRFQSLTVADLTIFAELSPLARYGKLREILLREVDKARANRLQTHHLFSATHLAAYFPRALRQFARDPDRAFTAVSLFRESRPVSSDLSKHVTCFLRLCKQTNIPSSFTVVFVASAILMDAYPPGMHGFEPDHVFSELYHTHCSLAMKESLPECCDEPSARQIKDVFVALSAPVLAKTKSAKNIRKALTAEKAHLWALIKSGTTCLFCIARNAQSTLPCGHVICNTCVRIFGCRSRGAEYFYLPSCILCLSHLDYTLRLKPPTANPRLLSIDGGGIKGVVALELLIALERALGPSQSFQDYFDMVIGTSSGGIIILDLFANKATVQQSSAKFDSFAQQVFLSRPLVSDSLFTYIRDLFIWWLSDSRYPSGPLEHALRDVFGESRGLSDSSTSHTKIAVTATSISDAKLCLLANYNGAIERNAQSAYRFLRPSELGKEAKLWEVARYTSAAPGYFSPKLYSAFGYLQDGGLSANNPLEAGLSELNVVWPDSPAPDVAVSIGTGRSVDTRNAFTFFRRSILFDGFIPRLFRALMNSPSLDGENSWTMMVNRLRTEDRDRYRRLNVPLACEPELDDSESINSLRHLTRDFISHMPDITATCQLLWATSFFLELDGAPQFLNGYYSCSASILCRSANNRSLVQTIVRGFPNAYFLTSTDQRLGFLSEQDGCTFCGSFRKRINFDVKSLDENLTILLAYSGANRRRIGGLPQSVRYLVDRQDLLATFGRSDHSTVRNKKRCDCTQSSSQRKRKAKVSAPGSRPSKFARNRQ